MGHHINKLGQFQSDKYPDLGPDKIILSFHDPAARIALYYFAEVTPDRDLGGDIVERLNAITKAKGEAEKASDDLVAMRESAIIWGARYQQAQANCEWLREQLAEAHRIIGLLVQKTTTGAGALPNLHKSYPGLHPAHGPIPGEKRRKDWESRIRKSFREDHK